MMKSLNTTVEAHKRKRDWALRRVLVPRQMSAAIGKALSSHLVKVITGPRRAGKSTLAFQSLADKNFAYLNFEDDALKDGVNSDNLVEAMDRVYGKTDYVFFDEIQNYAQWESFINKLHRRDRNLVITGSNSRLLSRELGSALTGRHLSFELLPFSYQEFLAGLKIEKGGGRETFHRYLTWGGFPEVVLGGSESQGYLRTLFDSVVLRDIVTRHHIRSSTAIYDLLNLLINNAASRFSARSLERSLGALSVATIGKFIAYFREAYLVHDLQPYFFKPRLRIKADRKIYAYDNGLISALSQPTTSNDSRLIENLVFVELVRRGFKPNFNLFYYQTRSGTEVDFLLREGSKSIELIQVTQNLSALKTRERELRALHQASEELKARHLTIITMDTEEMIREQGNKIRVVSCREWLKSRH
ncbi:MAG: ATP-binding protein [Elusimicrobia bacterium]|nr:ATP-binding protein [Elusimicrobiota bacterium]